ncbi:uncharacterized protein LOC111623714 [Centruroides sculpturatus]|uniref:uncharacterized protein LOC111623714 n=1 Tax=Centruroides sculpturatus TaxID=218467 RepID=UPI000C6DA5E2|nr:uncharacterized protein LOC111623714 [Centruroides sculpturatus]
MSIATPKCGIIVRNNNLNIALIPELSSYRITTAAVHNEPIDHIINAYFSPQDDDDDCIGELQNVLNKLGDTKYIIVGDINAKLALWYNEEEDNRGRLIQDILDKIDGISLNTSDIPTFETSRARGWTDVCLAPTRLGSLIETCETLTTTLASDHRYILTKIERTSQTISTKNNIYNRKTNWELFKTTFAAYWRSYTFCPLNTAREIDHYVNHLTTSLNSDINLSSTTNKVDKQRTHWWNSDLEREKRKIRRLTRH